RVASGTQCRYDGARNERPRAARTRDGLLPPGTAAGARRYPVNPDFGTYQLAEEHEALREAIRDLAEKEIAPHAAEVDEQERFPREAREALVKAGFAAVHVPEAYEGQGADSVATCIVIEEVA